MSVQFFAVPFEVDKWRQDISNFSCQAVHWNFFSVPFKKVPRSQSKTRYLPLYSWQAIHWRHVVSSPHCQARFPVKKFNDWKQFMAFVTLNTNAALTCGNDSTIFYVMLNALFLTCSNQNTIVRLEHPPWTSPWDTIHLRPSPSVGFEAPLSSCMTTLD